MSRFFQFSLATSLLLSIALPATARDSQATPTPPTLNRGSSSLPIQAVYSNIQESATSNVPGLPGVKFNPGLSNNNPFTRIKGSPNGNWGLIAIADTPGDDTTVFIVNGQVEVKEHDLPTWGGPHPIYILWDTFGINDAGEFLFTVGYTPENFDLVKGTPSGARVRLAQTLRPYTPPLPEDSTLGGFLFPFFLTNQGDAGFRGAASGLPPSEDGFLFLGDEILAQTGVDVPTGQSGAEAWTNISVIDSWVTPDGTQAMIAGELADTTEAVALDGMVVAQEGSILPASGFSDPVFILFSSHLAADGRYSVFGTNTDGHDWIYSNGEVIAELGQPIITGATELWDDTLFPRGFIYPVGNGRGQYVIGGTTNAADEDANEVLVVNGERVIAREGDPIDLDGNGLFDDDTFLEELTSTRVPYLTDDGRLYFLAQIKNGEGETVGFGLLTTLVFEELFTDGFENGTVDAWSSSQTEPLN